LIIHDKNKRAQQSHKQNNLKTMTTPRFFLVDKLMIPNQTKPEFCLSESEKEKEKEKEEAQRTLCVYA
jgi:hypothetical protein